MLWFANQLSALTPHSRCFRLRRWAFVAAGAKIHPAAKITGTVRLHHANVQIGESFLAPGTQLMASSDAAIIIGDRCALAPDVMFHCHTHEVGTGHRRWGNGISSPITIGDGTWVGTRATFIAGASVGSGCLIAAGSLVRNAFGDNVMLAGVPARIVKVFDD